MEIHLDALGGMAGDMFAAALLDAFPEHEPGVLKSIKAATAAAPVRCTLMSHNDGILQGRRFVVEAECASASASMHVHSNHTQDRNIQAHGHFDGAPHEHNHVHTGHKHWTEIRGELQEAALEPDVRSHALAIFSHLADAEARVHGLNVEDVAFHEVGAWDSIADIVAAAYLIAAIGAGRWSVGALPLGSGRIKTAHGLLPVPTPATALLLEGFLTLDDGVPGERVTPTGAAILRYIFKSTPNSPRAARLLGRSGVGFGTKHLPGISNCVRVLTYDKNVSMTPSGHRDIAVIEFEVDDQSAEELAMGLDRLREHHAVFDVVQSPVFGKKGRMMTHVRTLARADALNEAVAACFRETTTIGLRHQIVDGATLPRQHSVVEVSGRKVRVKTVERPGGRTAKAEADDMLSYHTHAARAGLRREAERLALDIYRRPAGTDADT